MFITLAQTPHAHSDNHISKNIPAQQTGCRQPRRRCAVQRPYCHQHAARLRLNPVCCRCRLQRTAPDTTTPAWRADETRTVRRHTILRSLISCKAKCWAPSKHALTLREVNRKRKEKHMLCCITSALSNLPIALQSSAHLHRCGVRQRSGLVSRADARWLP